MTDAVTDAATELGRWDLWHRDPRATPFQSPPWIDGWWHHLGGGERLDAIVRDGERLVAHLPLFVWHDAGVRRLVPVASGLSDYSDALLSPGTDIDRLWQAILAHPDRWDELLLPDLRPDSPLAGPMPPGWAAEDTPGETCPVLKLPPEGSVLAALSKSRRRKIVHDRNRADTLGGVTTAFAPDVDAALSELFSLHADRWARAGEPGVLADPRVQAFHRAIAPRLAEAGLLRLVEVRHDGRVVAILHAMADRHRGYSYINGVDQVPGQSFGTLAFAHAIEDAHAAGATEYHFLRGEEPYKFAWGAEPTYTIRRRITRI